MKAAIATLERQANKPRVVTAAAPTHSTRWGYSLLALSGVGLVGLSLSNAVLYGEWDIALALLPQALFSTGIVLAWLAAMFLGGPDPYLTKAQRIKNGREP